MNRMLLLLISLMAFFQITNAQRFSLGCKGGLDFVNIRFDPASENWGVTNRQSFDLGIIAYYNPSKLFKVQYESGFIEKGGQLKFKNVDEKWLYKFGYFSNQLVLIINPIHQLNIDFGVELGHTLYVKRVDIPGRIDGDRMRDYNKNDYSAIIGLGFNFHKNFTLNLRYVYGFTPLKDCVVYLDPGPIYFYEIYNKYISIGLRYYFLNIQ